MRISDWSSDVCSSDLWNAAQPTEKIAYLALWAMASAWPTIGTAMSIDAGLLQVYGLDTFFGLAGYLFLGAYVHEAYTRRNDKRRYWYTNLRSEENTSEIQTLMRNSYAVFCLKKKTHN